MSLGASLLLRTSAESVGAASTLRLIGLSSVVSGFTSSCRIIWNRIEFFDSDNPSFSLSVSY